MDSKFKIAALLGLIVTGTITSCTNNRSNKGPAVENNHHTASESTYACPMHPEITGKQGDNCSKCGMELKAVASTSNEQYQVHLSTVPQLVEAGKQTELLLAPKKDGKNVAVDLSHEKKIHLIAVNEELTWFRHLHPKEQADGTYSITETFPNGGNYLLFADFKPKGGEQTISKMEVDVRGTKMAQPAAVSTKWVSNADGYKVSLANGSTFKTNRAQPLEITLEKDGKQLSSADLEPYLGAVAHIILIDQSTKKMLHVHPGTTKQFPIHGETIINTPGSYRIWVQFKTNGQVHTADFTINVAQGAHQEDTHPAHQH